MLYLTTENTNDINTFNRFNVNIWDEVKDRVTFKLVNRKVFNASNNSEDIIHQDFLDLSKVYIISELSKDRKKIKTYELRKEDMERLNINEEVIQATARINMRNSKKKRIYTLKEDAITRETLYPLIEMNEQLMLNGVNSFIKDNEHGIDNVLMITNKYNVFGASYMMDWNTLKDIYYRMKSNFYILPISQHKIMCINANYVRKGRNLEEVEDDLLDMLFEINNQNKDLSDVLSYKMYIYMGDDGGSLYPIKQRL